MAEIENFDSVKEITDYFDEALNLMTDTFLWVSSSFSLVPLAIKYSLTGLYDELTGLCKEIEENMNHANEGINSNVEAYRSFEEENEGMDEVTINSISQDNQFYWGYLTANGRVPERIGSDYFANLASSGVGSWNSEKNLYTFFDSKTGTTYEYYANSGKMNILNDKKLWIAVGFYKPSGVTDLSDCDTVTLLFGDGERVDSNKYLLDKDQKVESILSQKNNGVIIVPQCPGEEFGNRLGHIEVSEQVVHSTKFAQLFMQQNEECANNIIGASSGGIAACDIASNAGVDVYDKVVAVNSYANFDRNTLLSENLKQKEVLFLMSRDDQNMNSKLSNSLKDMYDNGYTKVQIITNNDTILKQADSYGFTTQYRADDNWYGHGNGIWYSLRNSGIMGYLGGD